MNDYNIIALHRDNGNLAVRLLPFAREVRVRGRGSTLDHEARSLFQG